MVFQVLRDKQFYRVRDPVGVGSYIRGELKVLPYMAADRSIFIRQSDKGMLPLLSLSTGGKWKSLGQNREIPHAVYYLRQRLRKQRQTT